MTRDEMLIWAGMIAAYREDHGLIDIPIGACEHNGSFNRFIIDSVADYIMSGSTEDFGSYISEVLEEEWG